MLNYEVSEKGYEQFKKDLQTNKEAFPWFESELKFQESFQIKADREITLHKNDKDYRDYIDAYARFCSKIGVDLENTSDKQEGFYVDKFINNIDKNVK